MPRNRYAAEIAPRRREVINELKRVAWPIALIVVAEGRVSDSDDGSVLPMTPRYAGALERHDLKCTIDPNQFFPKKSEHEISLYAREECLRCPVLDSCMEQAMGDTDTFGIRGGLTVNEYSVLRTQAASELGKMAGDLEAALALPNRFDIIGRVA